MGLDQIHLGRGPCCLNVPVFRFCLTAATDCYIFVFLLICACSLQSTDVTSPKPCLSLSTPFSWDATTFSVPASTTQTSDTDSDSGFDSHDVCI